ncbi:MAG: 23S rRNA (guanosine(2251)-2'-O)-methyltransferase RlmB [Candidatus Dasytiphilus stammeri]
MQQFIVGLHAVFAILQTNPKKCKTLYVLHKTITNKRIKKIIYLAKNKNISIKEVTGSWFKNNVRNINHQGVMITFYIKNQYNHEKDLPNFIKQAKNKFFLILEGITDPHNLGACIRSAKAAGVHAVIIPKHHSATFHNVIVKKVACGAIENMTLFSVTNIKRIIRLMQEHHVWVIGTTTEKLKKTIYESNLTGEIALLMGGENVGIRSMTSKLCDELIYIPMINDKIINSLNVSVATGICLFEAVRQRYFNN